jgi:hypothetical protein
VLAGQLGELVSQLLLVGAHLFAVEQAVRGGAGVGPRAQMR